MDNESPRDPIEALLSIAEDAPATGRSAEEAAVSEEAVPGAPGSTRTDEVKGQDKAPAWDEGLTPQERADAKRRYKNRKGVERWRKRKQAQRAKEKELQLRAQEEQLAAAESGEGAGADQGQASGEQGPQVARTASSDAAASTGMVGQQTTEVRKVSPDRHDKPGWTKTDTHSGKQTERMLHEFKRLGKTNETKMKSLLDNLASYAMIPHGFQRHKGRIVKLAEDVLAIARNGSPTTMEVAQRFLRWGIRFSNAWDDPAIPNFQQIMKVFAEGNDGSTFVKVALQDGTFKSVSLKQLSQFDETVHKELYISLVHQILREMPQALTNSQTASRAKEKISRQMKQASMVASGYVIGQFVAFTSQRAIRKNVAVPMQSMLYAAASLGLQSEICRRLWQIWDSTKADLKPLLEKNTLLERHLDRLLVMHDISNDGSYHAIFSAVEQLMRNFEEQFDVSYYADLKCSHELLTPLQLGLIAAAQVPRLPFREPPTDSIDPYFRISIIFESGVLPRYD